MKTSDFGYILPKELIAQEPWPKRDECRMLVLNKETGKIQDKQFFNISDFLHEGDLLVANETRVLPARLIGKKRETSGEAEILLLKKLSDENLWEALVKPGRRLKPFASPKNFESSNPKNLKERGPIVEFYNNENEVVLEAEIVDWGSSEGSRIIKLSSEHFSVDEALHEVGQTPLPPYIHEYSGDMEMYQTVYSASEKSAAAPTAGLHFTEDLIKKLKLNGIGWATVELEVGIDTFKPVTEDNPKDHKMHSEFYSVSEDTVKAIQETKSQGGRVVAVGTTSVRSLESASQNGPLKSVCHKATDLFILPGYEFKCVDAIITNFHVPQSTLMMLVTAFGGYDNVMSAYEHAIEDKYRFLSFGDAMFIY